MNARIKALAAGTSLLLLCAVNSVAFADGMPFGVKAPQASTAIPDTPDNTGSLSDGSAAAAAQLPKPLPPVPPESTVEVQPNTSFFGLSVGEYDPFRSSDHATSFNAELQPGVRVLGVLQPLFGAMATTKGSAMAYAGVGVPFHITQHVFLMPSAALGLYRAGGGYDLDRTVVGRLGAELAYQFDDKSRLGLNFDVISNGKSLQANNRTEMLALTYTRPFSLFSGASQGMNSSGGPQAMNTPDESSSSAPAETQAAADKTVAPAAEKPAEKNVAALAATATIEPAAAPAAPAAVPAPAAAPSTTAFPAASSTLTPAEKTTHDFP
ncbi:MAG: hypothetical protein KGL10_03930 [Alphaproteobacteria bacterium]|nr:hypothetical protein [Alphaproteobacteria bacterium]MDE2336438.1 hypothetical protein [Alphaproteobacteria bacterium]